jgi:hypothetical protein
MPSITKEGVNYVYGTNKLIKLAQEFIDVNLFDYKPSTFAEVMLGTPQHVKARYANAHDNLINGMAKQDLYGINGFVKYEKMDTSKMEEGKPPRMIQHRSYEYIYLLKKHLLPIIDNVKSNTKLFMNQEVNSYFTYGRNSNDIASLICEHWSSFKNPIALCLDHSKFDGHVNLELLKLEQLVFNKLSNNNKHLKHLLSQQLKNKGKTSNGLKYVTRGCRMSGEYNTSIGNSILNLLMLKSVFPSSKVVVNGDDSVVFLEYSEYKKLDIKESMSLFSDFGMVTKLEQTANELEEISFCQCNPVLIDGNYQMIRNPIRLLSRIQYTDLPIEQHTALIRSLAYAELSLNQGVPVLQQFGNWLLDLVGTGKTIIKVISQSFPLLKFETKIINNETRLSFSKAFGIDILEQKSLEKYFKSGDRVPNSQNINSEINTFVSKYNEQFKNKIK